MARNQTEQGIAGNASCGARAVSITAGTLLLWRALGVPPLGRIALGFAGLGLIWHGLSPGSSRESERAATARVNAKARDAVHRASEESFPASDPPSWTPTNGPSRPH